ncbi:hypothetical protein D187_003100 [Cystobacter fuscus DSM 2262]|uniref:Uncharacterized protein n=1 Tax=Cystobacter fuscus (strain ATCC 25194 / DSM 2262 / NBRC 100088 / M29) TaxID=1242864 RepID=S9P7U7_CYSF2|nr:hypothetical protein D187_003100 [Cystobacter fuscus DSM 2262]
MQHTNEQGPLLHDSQWTTGVGAPERGVQYTRHTSSVG